MLPLEALEDSLRALVQEYQDLNPSLPAELNTTPTALAFSRSVAANRPLVVRGEGHRQAVPALARWSNAYLARTVVEPVTVAVSPNGRADSIIDDYFVEPASVDMPLADLFATLNKPDGPVYYLQSQNGNLGGQLACLADDVGTGPPWAAEVFGEPPEAVNVWIGDGRSVTSMHKDPYENIYLVVRGTKTFTLLPPTEFYCVHEGVYPPAQYVFTPPSSFTLVPTPSARPVPWIPVDPLAAPADRVLYPRYALARPMTVTLHPGDVLYLPALWFHQVEQAAGPSPAAGEEGEGEAAIAVNWWSDMRMDGALWSTAQFLRRATLLLDGRVELDLF